MNAAAPLTFHLAHMKYSRPSLFTRWLLLAACLFLSVPAIHSADVTITAANLTPGVNAQFRRGTAGVAITAGQLVYLDVADNTWKLTDCNSATAAARDVDGIAASTSGAGQPLAVITSDDDLTLGGTVVNGTIYVASANAGGIAPATDMTTTWRPIVIGVAKSTTKILFRAEGLRSPTAL